MSNRTTFSNYHAARFFAFRLQAQGKFAVVKRIGADTFLVKW